MKKLILILAVIAASLSAYAQNDSKGKNNQSNTNGVMMQNGKMVLLKNGKISDLTREMTMSNGIKIGSDGTYIQMNGSKIKMKEGEYMDMSGNLSPMKGIDDREMYLIPDSTKHKN